ncbi:hypothetical protein JYT26_01905 [Beggiatoa alba]|nr:hypothetical protein [Beggiatoa alba]
MTDKPEILALQQSYSTCRMHQEALCEALVDLDQSDLTEKMLQNLDKEQRRLLDQFAYRYIRLQDDMGNRLLKSVLLALGEDIAAMPVIDRLNRLEQLEWLPSAEEWMGLRKIRNNFTHEYPETAEERFARITLAIQSARRISDIFDEIGKKIVQRFPELKTEI